MLRFEMELLSFLWHIKFVFLVCTVGTGEAADLFMCLEGRPTIPFTRLLLRRGSRQDTLSLMTWTDTNRRDWVGWTWPLIKVQGKRNYCNCRICKWLANNHWEHFNVVFIHLLWTNPLSTSHCPNLSRKEVEHSQCLPETCPGSTQPEDGGALPNHQDHVWWQQGCGCGIHTEWTKEKGKVEFPSF